MPRRARPGRTPKLLLEPAIAEHIFDDVRAHVPLTRAADRAGINTTTLWLWRSNGLDAADKLSRGEELTEREQLYLQFSQGLAKAEADGLKKAMSAVASAAYEGSITTRTKTDSEGNIIEQTVTENPPDARMAAWILEHRYADDLPMQRTGVELTGPDGGPIQVAASPSDILAKIRATRSLPRPVIDVDPIEEVDEA